MTIQTPDTRGPWDQREAEAAAAGLAVAAILAAAGDGTATLAIHCWPAESGTQAHVYARVPADAARTLTDEHPPRSLRATPVPPAGWFTPRGRATDD